MGRVGIGPSEGPGRLLGQTPQHWEGCQNTRGGTTEDQGDAEPKRRARPKAKPKAHFFRRSPRRLAGQHVDCFEAEPRGGEHSAPGASYHQPHQCFLNSLPRWLLKTRSSLQGLLRSILTMPRRDQCPTSRSKCTWPMAIPYPEAFSSGAHLDERSM